MRDTKFAIIREALLNAADLRALSVLDSLEDKMGTLEKLVAHYVQDMTNVSMRRAKSPMDPGFLNVPPSGTSGTNISSGKPLPSPHVGL